MSTTLEKLDKVFEHKHRHKRDNLLYTVKFGYQSSHIEGIGYFFIEVIDDKNLISLVYESRELSSHLEDLMTEWGANERNVSELSDLRLIK